MLQQYIIEDFEFLVGSDANLVQKVLSDYCNLGVRAVIENGHPRILTQDWRTDRVNVVVDNHKITKFKSIG